MSEREESTVSDEQRAQFYGNLSHQFAEPLNIILNGTEYIRTSLKEGTAEQQQEAIRMSAHAIQDSVRWLDRLAQNMVDMLALSSGGLCPNCQIIELSSRLRNLLELCLPYANHQNMALHWNPQKMPVHVFVFADKAFVDRILLNLLSNAIQYSRPNGNIWVELTIVENEFRIVVRDDGPGISAKDQQLLFDPFQAFNTHAMQHGVGIGLYLAHEFCKSMNWQLHIKSNEEGTEAVIHAPIGVPAQGSGLVGMASNAFTHEISRQEQAGRIHREMAALFGELNE